MSIAITNVSLLLGKELDYVDNGYIEILSPEREALSELIVVVKGSYKLLSKMKNLEEGNEPGR